MKCLPIFASNLNYCIMEKILKSNRKWTLVSAIVWALSYMVFVFIVKKFEPPMGIGIIFTGVLSLGFAWFLYNFIRELSLLDEVQRSIQLEAIAIAFCLSVLVTMVLGILEMVMPLDNDNWNLQELVAVFFLSYAGGLLWARKKYA